jgi:hypothetical protein
MIVTGLTVVKDVIETESAIVVGIAIEIGSEEIAARGGTEEILTTKI